MSNFSQFISFSNFVSVKIRKRREDLFKTSLFFDKCLMISDINLNSVLSVIEKHTINLINKIK